jgi:hypothetical protein
MGDLAGQDVTNMAGRIEITADNTLDLTQTRISALEYLLLKATNHFIGNAGAVIQSPNYDMILRSTNGTLTSSNLIVPNLFSPLGIVNLDSERWVEVNAAGITNTYHVLFVDSQITPLSPLFAQTLSLKANNAANPEADSIFISDILNVTRSLYLDARSLTLTTNDGGAFTPVGQLNLLSSDIFWSTAAPRLRYLTNFGYITSGNLIYFAGNMTTPYDSRANATPYQTFVNHGWITNQGIFVYTKYFENSGVIEETPFGSIDLQTQCATITNGSLIAPAGHISLNAASLVISNSFIQSSAAMSLIVTNCLTDGYSLGNQFGQIVTSNTPANIVTNGNTWTVSGINLRANPSGDLLATTITNTAGFNNEVFNYWSGNDVGRTPAGFANNLALGRLILDGQTNSLFTFHGTGGNKAIYVDYLEFKDYTTNRNASGDFIGVNIGSDIKIYFAQAVMNGQSIADKLDGKNNGRFIWVTNYAGVYSSTNILYPDGNTYIFNRGLVESCLIDSDGDTIANCSDPTPIPTNWILTSVVSAPLCECIFSSQIENTAGGSPTSGSDNSSNAHRGKLLLPVHVTPSSGTVSFAAAKGIYNGLFYETNGVKSASSGYITVVTTPTGGYSAKLQRGAQLYSFSGQFNGTGYSTKTISGKGLPTLTIELDLSQEDQINGQVTSGGNWSSQLFAARVSSASNPAGKYTLLIQGDTENPQTTTGDGFGSVTINANGAVQWNGTLADGTKVTQKTALSKNGIWPFYSSLYSGAGSLIGWIQFTNRVGDDLNGTVLWILPPNSRAQYPAGFTNELEAVGSRLTGAFGFANGLNILSGGILDSVVTNHVVVSGNKLVSQNANLTISANPGSGLFKGSFFDSVSGQSILFQGALLEKSGFGTGFFLSPNQSGKVYLGSAPEPQP